MHTALQLPVTVYRYDAGIKQYVFQSCMQCVVQGAVLPRVLTSGASQGMVAESLELLKAAMRAPAVVLCKGTQIRIYNASCDEVKTLPPTEPARLIRAYELPYLNLSTQIVYYRLRGDGALALVDTGKLHCAMCYVPEQMRIEDVRGHLRARAHSVRKLLRDRRIVVEMNERACVFSCETLRCKP